jgi:signal transduction histidine kinase
VKDNGRGIRRADREKLFTPFFTTKKGGTGLGLPVCKKIVEEHGGTLALDSEEGAGATVTIEIPLTPAA